MSTSAVPPKRLLVIEDDKDIRTALVEVLEDEGYEVLSAANGQEGLDVLEREKRPNAIVLDLMMPVKDGFVFREEQLRAPALADIPVVVMTADGHIDAKARKIQSHAWVRKPVDLDVFLKVMAQVSSSDAQ